MKKALSVCAVMFIAYAAFVWKFPEDRPRGQSQSQQNRIVLERFLAGESPVEIVFVGTSLTTKLLVERSQLRDCAYNLAIDGGSVLTGLRAIKLSERRPKTVMVETNFPNRPADEAILRSTSSRLLRYAPFLRTENVPVNRALSYAYRVLHGDRPPTERPLVEAALKEQQRWLAKTVAPQVLSARTAELVRLVTELEASGTQVVFYEMPVAPSLTHSAAFEQTRAQMKAAFAPNRFIKSMELTGDEPVATTDGVHLSALTAAAVLNRFPVRCDEAKQARYAI